jgi:hypothetical protein
VRLDPICKVVVMKRLILLASVAAFGCSSPTSSNGGNLPDGKTGLGDGVLSGDGTSTTEEVLDAVDFDSPFACKNGDVACFNETTSKICVDGGWKLKETCNSGDVCKDGTCYTPANCTAGSVVGCDGFSTLVHCAADGLSTYKTACDTGQLCVDGACKVTACVPYIPECAPGSKTSFHTCLPDGSGYGDITDCKPGTACFAGKCVSLCEQGLKFSGNVGCEYWSVDLDNDMDTNPATGTKAAMVPHSVVISNPGEFDATMTFTIQATCADGSVCSPTETTCNNKKASVCETPGASVDLIFADNAVPAGQTKEFKMPVMNLNGSGVMRKAIHIKSTQPVVAYQGNPYHAEGAASNDGSLLLPQNALGKTYYAVVPAQSRGANALFGTSANSAFVTVVATLSGTTTVSVTPTRDCLVNYKLGVPGDGTTPKVLSKGTTYTFQLLQFDVLNIEEVASLDIVPTNTGPGSLPNMTGTKVEADKPVAVFSGHQVAGVEDDFRFGQSSGSESTWSTCCTEHMEEQLMPLEFWGKAAFCVKTKPRGDEVDEFVVIAGENGVKLTTNPPSVATYPNGKELNGQVLNIGQRARVQTNESFMLSATGKIQVAQVLVSAGQTAQQNNGTAATLGDASMAMVPSQSQYRPDYTVQTPTGFQGNYVSVVRPVGLGITLDGSPLNASFQSFGDGTWEFAYVKLNPGTHTIASVATAGGTGTPFGLMVYGYGGVTAYSYPGGMILK